MKVWFCFWSGNMISFLCSALYIHNNMYEFETISNSKTNLRRQPTLGQYFNQKEFVTNLESISGCHFAHLASTFRSSLLMHLCPSREFAARPTFLQDDEAVWTRLLQQLFQHQVLAAFDVFVLQLPRIKYLEIKLTIFFCCLKNFTTV